VVKEDFAMLTQGQVLQQRYRVIKLLGQGGMGAVYRGWDLRLERSCALKENLDVSSEAQRQFGREAAMLSNASHPNLPRVTDYFTVPGQGQYLVMDFVEGEDLQEMLDRRGSLPESEVMPWVEQICDALHYLHTQNPPIIHRDVKPANIKITPGGRPMLVDFGIAKVYDPAQPTTMGARAVTPGYSPPEQYGRGSTDPRSDIYSLGATLYTLLTGQEPVESLERLVGTATLTSPRQINLRVSQYVAQVICRCMELKPTQRYQTADALKSALRPHPSSQGPQMVAATPPSSRAVSAASSAAQAVPVGQPVYDKTTGNLAVAALVLGVGSWLTMFVCGLFSIPLAVAGLVTGWRVLRKNRALVSKGDRTKATVGIVAAAVLLALTVLGLVFYVIGVLLGAVDWTQF
jgi:serine/threonine protein kinase